MASSEAMTAAEIRQDSVPAPQVIAIPLAGANETLVIVHEGRAMQPPEGLCQLRGLMRDPASASGVWLAAAQAANERWGLLVIDAEGCRWRASPTLENLFGLSADGLARFSEHGRWGYLDAQGHTAIAPQFPAARAFARGRAAVQLGEHRWRFIDTQNRFVGDETFHELWSLGESGLARALRWPNRGKRGAGFVDSEGRWVVQPRYHRVQPVGPDGVAPAQQDEDALWGLINCDGQWVLVPRYRGIDAFNAHGLAYYTDARDLWNIRHGYLDARGRVVVEGGSYLSGHMVCGIAAATYDGSSYVRADGTALQTPPLSYGTHFRSDGGYAVARTRAVFLGDADPAWGLLRSDGAFIAAPADLREPVTDGDGWIAPAQPNSGCAAFLTAAGGVAWLDPAGRIVWRAQCEGECATLRDAHGNLLWQGASPQGRMTYPFFNAPLEDHLEGGLRTLDDVLPVAQALLAEAEQRLRGLAAGETLAPAVDDDGEDDDEDDEDDLADEEQTQAARCVVSRRVMRAYINEDHNGHYSFLWSRYTDQVDEALQTLRRTLSQHFGAPDPAPQTWLPLQQPGERCHAWAVPLQQALPGDSGAPAETRRCWIALYAQYDAGDGDAWAELWLQASPGSHAMQAALHARAHVL